MSAPAPPRPPLAETGRVPLAAAVETAAYAAAPGAELLVLVNRPGAGAADLLRILPAGAVETLAPLPLVAAGMAACAGGVLVTGAGPDGSALVMQVAADGRPEWRCALPGPAPTRWPVPGCAPGPVVAWQAAAGTLEVAEGGPGGIARARTVPVGGPPLDATVGGGAAWAAWTERDGVRVVAVHADGVEERRLPARFPSDVAVGAAAAGAAVAWTEGAGAFLARLGEDGAGAPAAVELGPAEGGTLAVVAGPEPLVWAQRVETREGEPPGAVSALALPGRAPALVHELVFAVAWWGRRLAVVCAGAVRLFDLEET